MCEADHRLTRNVTRVWINTVLLRLAWPFWPTMMWSCTREISIAYLGQGNVFGLVYTPYCWSEIMRGGRARSPTARGSPDHLAWTDWCVVHGPGLWPYHPRASNALDACLFPASARASIASGEKSASANCSGTPVDVIETTRGTRI